MRPPALEIRLILQPPRGSWGYVVRKYGGIICASEEEAFDQPGRAFMAAVADVKAAFAVPPEEEE